tara:strand:- start:181 stop:399 length:219 start_codon:yes stop_codon:yes gene_type:complete
MHNKNFSKKLSVKISLMLVTWGFALIVSFAFRYLGVTHPEPFKIRSAVLWSLIYGPPVLLFFWLLIPVNKDN